MKIFLKLLPYLLIVCLGFSIYYSFIYYQNKIDTLSSENACLINDKFSLEKQLESTKSIDDITIKQLQNIQIQIKDSLSYINEISSKIDSLSLDNPNKEELLNQINAYELCIAKNSNNPNIICNLEIK